MTHYEDADTRDLHLVNSSGLETVPAEVFEADLTLSLDRLNAPYRLASWRTMTALRRGRRFTLASGR